MCDWNWNAIIGVGTMALAIIAFGSFWLQFYFSRQQGSESRAAVDRMIAAQLTAAREENGVRLYLHMKEIWDSERMEQGRKALAEYFINAPTPRTEHFYEQMKERVPNFFEDLGSMLKLKLVDEKLIYDLMSYHVKGWYAVCEPYILWLQEDDKELFENFKILRDRMKALEPTEDDLSKERIREFLEEEYGV
jgi:hypothetical protein